MVGCDPWLTLIAQGDRVELRTSGATHVVRAHPLEALREVLRRYQVSGEELGAASRAVGLMGWLSYDLNRWIERLPVPQPSGPVLPEMAWFGMRLVILADHIEGRSWLISVVDPHGPRSVAHRAAERLLDEAQRLLHDPSTRATASGRGLAQDSAPRASIEVPRALPVGLHDTPTFLTSSRSC